MISSLLFWLSGLAAGWAMRSFVLLWRSRKRKPVVAAEHLTPEMRRQRSRARIRAAIDRQIKQAIDPDFDEDDSPARQR